MKTPEENLVEILQDLSIYTRMYKLKICDMQGSRDSFPNGHVRYIKIRHLNKKYREMYDKFIEQWQNMNENNDKYRNTPLTPEELVDLENNGYVTIYQQYTGNIEIITNASVKHLFTCHSCLYNDKEDIILFDIWHLNQEDFPNTQSYREYDIIIYNGKTGYKEREWHAINSRIGYGDESLYRLKIALSLFYNGFCQEPASEVERHFFQCPKILGTKTTSNPNKIDTWFP
ncbi:MAG TPA: hypothetical protein PKD85_05175 [Saprospiraceae bacterium]|nr:hypothetical protein [Saprospiraceae bacterium]